LVDRCASTPDYTADRVSIQQLFIIRQLRFDR
jgi:hypothetical protein